MEVANISVKVQADIKKATDNLNSFQDKMTKIGKNLTDTGKKMTLGVTLPIVGMVAGFAKSAMDLEATEAKYGTVFAGMTADSDAFIEEFKKLTPATTASARNMASGIQDLLIPMGFMREEATELTGDTMHLVGALTNFNSATHSAEDVSGAFQSALTGSYESLKRLGIQVSKEQVTNKAYEMGLAKQGEEVTKQMQAQALMALAYEQSGDALTAYTEENLDAKTKMGLLGAKIVDVSADFGEILLPAITSVIEAVTKIIDWFSGLDDGLKTNILIFMGVVAAIGPVVWIVGILTTAIGMLSTAFAFLISPIGLAILAFAAVIAVGVLLYKNWDKIMEWAGKLWVTIKRTFTDIKDKIFDVFKNINLFQIGKDIISGLTNGIKSMIGGVGNAVKNVASKIGDGFKKFFRIGSPSKLMAGYGENIGEGLAIGIDDATKKVSKASMSMSSTVTGEMLTPKKYNFDEAKGNQFDYKQLAHEFKKVITGLNVVLNDEQVGNFVDTRIIKGVSNV